MRAFLDQHGAWGPGRCRASFALSCRDLIEHAAIAEVRALYLRPAAKVGNGGELQWREARRMACAELAYREQRLVLPGHQHIPESALHERGRRAASAGVEHQHVLVEPAHELPRTRLVAPRLRAPPGPGGQIVPAGAAGGLGVGRDD